MLNCSGKFLLAYNILLFTVTHYQIINGLERVVEGSTEAKHIHMWLRWRLRLKAGFLIMYKEVWSLWIGLNNPTSSIQADSGLYKPVCKTASGVSV
ncbi:unnamed protein product [Brassica rapa]|uniref:Uncharacterized protein n=1 Tax=Brassica campestris TaxID=3711 RepID=A0A8D9HZK1_BRACM|nr:unnamed protein product [Brassica rapa]